MSYPSKDEYYLSKIREERGKVEQLEKDKQELIKALLTYRDDISEEAEEETGIYVDDILERQTGKSIEELLK